MTGESGFRWLVIVLLAGICALLVWVGLKLDRVYYAIPEMPRGLASDVDQIQRDVDVMRREIERMAPPRPLPAVPPPILPKFEKQ